MATQDTVTQLIAAVRRVRRLVPAAAALIADRCHARDWDDPAKPEPFLLACVERRGRLIVWTNLFGDGRVSIVRVAAEVNSLVHIHDRVRRSTARSGALSSA